MKILRRTQFGNPILRETARQLTAAEITSESIQELIIDMRHTLAQKKLGVGLAAPQVGKSLALTVIHVQPTESRPDVLPFEAVLINPIITKYSGQQSDMWEGCISGGSSGTADLFAKTPRNNSIEVTYLDERGKKRHEKFKGLQAQIVQHEVDHLNGILFVDHVTDTRSYTTYAEYMKRVVSQ
ncbi:peptide deformylase [Aeromicrobium sp.]|nr:peptide deformylase [Candidatus Saccharibacteria bacterium]